MSVQVNAPVSTPSLAQRRFADLPAWLRILLVGVLLLSGAWYVYRTVVSPLREWQGDFIAYYLAGRMVLDGRNPYDADLRLAYIQAYDTSYIGELAAVYEELATGLRAQGLEPVNKFHGYAYLNPPQFAFLLAPLALLPPRLASAAWLLISQLCYGTGLLLLVRALRRPLWWWEFSLVFFLATASVTAFGFFMRGQSSALLFLSLVLAVLAMERGRPLRASLALLVGIVVKPFASGPIALLWLAWRRYRAVIVLVTAGLLSTALCLQVIGWQAMADWVVTELPQAYTEQTEAQVETNLLTPSFFGLTQRYMPGYAVEARLLALGASLALVAATATLVLRKPQPDGRTARRLTGLVLAAAVLAAPYDRTYDNLLLWIPILFMMDDLPALSRLSPLAPFGWLAVAMGATLSFHGTVHALVCLLLWGLEAALLESRAAAMTSTPSSPLAPPLAPGSLAQG
ncbi:MAG: glycosyltransferase family 87 protein [Anaerolineae bacterium]